MSVSVCYRLTPFIKPCKKFQKNKAKCAVGRSMLRKANDLKCSPPPGILSECQPFCNSIISVLFFCFCFFLIFFNMVKEYTFLTFPRQRISWNLFSPLWSQHWQTWEPRGANVLAVVAMPLLPHQVGL